MSDHGTDQQRTLSADQERMAELQRLLGKYGQVEIQELMARLEQAEMRAEQAAIDAARIAVLEAANILLVQHLVEARVALERHGTHPASCPKGTGIGYYNPTADTVCDCGIDAALGASRV